MDDRLITGLKQADQIGTDSSAEDQFRLSSGVVIGFQVVPPMVIMEIQRQFKTPNVPEIWDEGLKRAIRNPNDPDYLARVADANLDRGLAMTDAMLALGTRVISVPDTVDQLDSDVWIERLEPYIGSLPREGSGRYLAWLKYVALQDEDDIELITNRALGKSLVTEKGVADQLERFPDTEV